MSTVTIGNSKSVRLLRGERLTVTTAASSTALVTRKNKSDGGADVSETSMLASITETFGPYPDDEIFNISSLTGSLTESSARVDLAATDELTTETALLDTGTLSALIGALATAPVSGTVAVNITRVGFFYLLDFTLTAAQIPVTDAGASGSFGALNLFDLVEGAFNTMGGRQDFTVFAEGSALTGDAGDAVFDIGVGSVAIASAADGALAGTDDDIIAETAITLSGGTGTGTNVVGGPLAINGTASAGSINLNWSGTAATIDANSTIDVTGTISVLIAALGDD